jgi:hypothetical protein
MVGLGCGKDATKTESDFSVRQYAPATDGRSDDGTRSQGLSDIGAGAGNAENDIGKHGVALHEARQEVKEGKGGGVERKIVYTSDVHITVPHFAKAEEKLLQLVQANQGIIAKSDLAGSAGSNQSGTWQIRVPVPKFNEFREAVKKLGDLTRYSSDAKDVTEEYYDLEIRVKNKVAELDTLRKLFDKATGKIDEIAAVVRELSRAQEELERMKGRQRVLEKLIEMTTITVRLQERGTYEPSEPASFGSQVDKTFSGSTDVLVGFGKLLALAAVALAPWLPLLALIIGLPLWLFARGKRVSVAVPAGAPSETKP